MDSAEFNSIEIAEKDERIAELEQRVEELEAEVAVAVDLLKRWQASVFDTTRAAQSKAFTERNSND